MARTRSCLALIIVAVLGIVCGDASTAWSQAVIRTFVAHQITSIYEAPNPGAGWQPKISHSGNRAVFTMSSGGSESALSVHVINFDGSGATTVGGCTPVCYGLDISDDGGRIIFGPSYGAISIVNADGNDKRTLVALSNAISAIRISADGNFVFFHVPENSSTIERGIYVINGDGTGLRQIVGPAQIAALLGIPVGQAVLNSSGAQTLDVSDDNQHIIFGVYQAYYGVNFDGSGLHLFPPGVVNMTDRSAISGDGTRVVMACSESSIADYKVYAMNWEGTGKRYLADCYDLSCQSAWSCITGGRLSLSMDGRQLLVGNRAVVYDTVNGTKEQLGAGATGYGPPDSFSSLLGYDALNSSFNSFVTMDDNATRGTRRFVYVAMIGPDCTAGNGWPVLATIETDPADFGNAPVLVAPNIYPTTAAIGEEATFGIIAFTPGTTEINYVSAAMLFEGLKQCFEFDLGELEGGAFYSASFTVTNSKFGPRTIRFEADNHEEVGGSCRMHATAVDVVPFAIGDGSPPPGKVSLVSPSGTISTTTPTFTWNPVTGAVWYRLQVFDSSGLKIDQQYSAGDICTASLCAVTPGIALALGDGCWQVQASNNGGSGPWSDSLNFKVEPGPPQAATLISPSGTITTATPTYIWNAVSNSTWYYLWVSDSTGDKIKEWYTAAQAGCGSGTGTCSVTPGTTLATGSAKWWVQTYNASGYGPWSSGMAFTVTAPGLPGKAVLISPSGTIATTTPTYTWNAVSNATWYYLWVDDASGNKIKQWYTAAQAGCGSGTGTCAVTPAVAVGGASKWWIQTWNAVGYGPWSDGMSFTAPAPVLPGKAVLISPSGTITTTTPTYTWNAVSNSTWYYLWVSDSTGDKINEWYTAAQAGCASGTGTCAVTPGAALATGSAKWWVQTYNANGYGPWSDGMAFTVSAPGLAGKATLISPSGAITTTTPTYKWNAVSDSTWYYLWVSDSTGDKIKQWYTAAEAGCASGTGTCQVTPSTALAQGSCTWWIMTYNAAGNGPWSDRMDFTIGGQSKHLHYRVTKVTGTNSDCQPRDSSLDTEGNFPGLQGTIPISYSETWDSGYANMTGSVTISPAAAGQEAQGGETYVKVDTTASWNSNGLGCCRNTGIFLSGCTGSDVDKGCIDNGSTSGSTTCTGPLDSDGITISVKGKQTRIIEIWLTGN